MLYPCRMDSNSTVFVVHGRVHGYMKKHKTKKNYGTHWSTSQRLKSTMNKTKKMQCSPAVSGKSISTESCYTNPIIIKIRDAYHRTHPHQPRIRGSPKQILKELQHKLKKQCEKEDCWLELLPKSQREYLDQYVFAPDQPQEWKNNPDEWLTNYDIMKVLQQYEIAYPNFCFLGPSPIDFDTRVRDESFTSQCVETTLCNFFNSCCTAIPLPSTVFLSSRDPTMAVSFVALSSSKKLYLMFSCHR